jgi:HEAT repeat protein
MARKQLEGFLASTVSGDVSEAAKDFCCRKLSLVGSAGCVASVAPLLEDEKLSHMARYALERIPDEAAVETLRGALPKVSGLLKVGVINSLGFRRDAESTAALVELLGDSDAQIASAAAAALGEIGTADAAKALGVFHAKAPDELKLAAADAYLACAERLLADGNKTQATMIYVRLAKSEIKQVKLAAVRGMLAARTAKP